MDASAPYMRGNHHENTDHDAWNMQPNRYPRPASPETATSSLGGSLMMERTRRRRPVPIASSGRPTPVPSTPPPAGVAPYPESGIGEEYIPANQMSQMSDIISSSLPSSKKSKYTPGEYLPDEEMVAQGTIPPPQDRIVTENMGAAAHILASPTLGLSESEWKAIPFSTRRKLKNSMEQVGSLLVRSTDNISSSVRSSISSPGSSGTIPGDRPLSFSSRRRRERALTMYPELEGGSARRPSDSSRTLNRSVSVSASPSSSSYSPAFQYLSRYGSTGTQQPAAASDGFLGEQIGNYVLGKLIGYGAFSQIREAVTFEQGKKMVRAVKIVKKHSSSESVRKMERLLFELDHEIKLWKSLDHPHILHLLSVEEDEHATYCFTEKISSGTLLNSVRKLRDRFSGCTSNDMLRAISAQALPTTVNYIQQLTSALIYLHVTMHIVHRDFKLENCLMEKLEDGSYKILICDFGMSDYFETEQAPVSNTSSLSLASMESDVSSNHHLIGPADTSSHIPDRNGASTPSNASVSRQSSSISLSPNTSAVFSSQNGGSLPYACPELLQSNRPIVNPCTDMWSFGVCMYALLIGKLPWSHAFAPKLRMMIIDSKWSDHEVERLYGKNVTDIIRGCLDPEPSKRWDILKVRAHVDKVQRKLELKM